MMPTKTILTLIFSTCLLCACASRPAVTLVSNSPSTDMQKMNGVPFRIKQRQLVRLYQWNPSTQKYDEVFSQAVVLADMSKLFSLDVKSQAFASPSLQITEASDNTITTTEVGGTDNSAAAIDALTSGISGYTTARDTETTTVASKTTAEVTAVKACQTAIQAQETLAATATDADKALAKANIELARKQIEQAYAVAGEPPPALCLSS